ncbi:hypothetical protein ACQEWB_34640 [Streptomyces sp. CA-249302]|uniref:hypothetical protein n=1 Tax=Streptomyces sp. CA-249302 TaxID=3240058 RepID=UPI003D93AA61
MTELTEIGDRVALVDARLKPIAERPVDTSDPDWERRMRERRHPLDEAGVRTEAEDALRDLVRCYERGGEPERAAVRALLSRHTAFRWAAQLPFEATPEGFRLRLLQMSVADHGHDTRDELVTLHYLREEAREAGVELRPILLEVAELSSAEDRFGMGSMRDILRNAAGR